MTVNKRHLTRLRDIHPIYYYGRVAFVNYSYTWLDTIIDSIVDARYHWHYFEIFDHMSGRTPSYENLRRTTRWYQCQEKDN